MWDLPGPGLKPGSPALAGGFLTTAPPGKSHLKFLIDTVKCTELFYTLEKLKGLIMTDTMI